MSSPTLDIRSIWSTMPPRDCWLTSACCLCVLTWAPTPTALPTTTSSCRICSISGSSWACRSRRASPSTTLWRVSRRTSSPLRKPKPGRPSGPERERADLKAFLGALGALASSSALFLCVLHIPLYLHLPLPRLPSKKEGGLQLHLQPSDISKLAPGSPWSEGHGLWLSSLWCIVVHRCVLSLCVEFVWVSDPNWGMSGIQSSKIRSSNEK